MNQPYPGSTLDKQSQLFADGLDNYIVYPLYDVFSSIMNHLKNKINIHHYWRHFCWTNIIYIYIHTYVWSILINKIHWDRTATNLSNHVKPQRSLSIKPIPSRDHGQIQPMKPRFGYVRNHVMVPKWLWQKNTLTRVKPSKYTLCIVFGRK